MATGTVRLRYFILGLLAQQPSSGYDIKRFLKDLNWLIGSPSSGSLYPTLRTLLQEDLVTVEVIPGLDRPPKKIYNITEAGRLVLLTWIDQLVLSDASLKAFVMRLLLAGGVSQINLIAHLQQRRAQVASHSDILEQATEAPVEEMDWGQRLVRGYGLALATAELTWLDSVLIELSEQLPHQKSIQEMG